MHGYGINTKSSFTFIAGVALLLGAGCTAPDGDGDSSIPSTQDADGSWIEPGGPVGLDDPAAEFVALAADGDQRVLQVLDASGRPGLTVPLDGVPYATRFAVHPDGFFIVKSQRTLYRVDVTGEASVFTDTTFNWIYGASVSADGVVTVAAETEVVDLDPDGNVVTHVPTGSQYCWMDVGATDTTTTSGAVGDSSGATSTVVDLWGSTLAEFSRSGGMRVLARMPFNYINLSTRDDAGTHWFGRTDGDGLWAWDADEGSRFVTSLGADTPVEGARALVPAGGDSVLAVVQRADGIAAFEVDGDGVVTPRFTEAGALWMDFAAL